MPSAKDHPQKAGQLKRQSCSGRKKGVNTMCTLQLENRLRVFLFFTVYVKKLRNNVWNLCLVLVYYWGSNWHLWASGCSALADHILAGTLLDFMALSSSHGISKLGCAGQSTEKVKSLTTQVWKRADHPHVLRILACSAINSQAAPAPQFTQKQNWADPRVHGLCMSTRIVLL